jgi:hypothetical protein
VFELFSTFFFLTSIAIKRPNMNQRTFIDDYYRLPDRNGSFEARQRTQSLVIEEIGNRCREGKKTKRIHIPDDDVHKGFKKFRSSSRQHREMHPHEQISAGTCNRSNKEKKSSIKHTQGLWFFGLCLPEYKQERCV